MPCPVHSWGVLAQPPSRVPVLVGAETARHPAFLRRLLSERGTSGCRMSLESPVTSDSLLSGTVRHSHTHGSSPPVHLWSTHDVEPRRHAAPPAGRVAAPRAPSGGLA